MSADKPDFEALIIKHDLDGCMERNDALESHAKPSPSAVRPALKARTA